MADKNTSFPKIPESNWWKLRDLFKRKVPALVTPSYLAAALSMTESSARSNLISPFKKIGILDEDGKPTDLAYDWRDDPKYPEVCKKIIDSTYPEEFRDLFHGDDIDSEKVIGWFMSYCRCGQPAAKMYGAFYRLLLQADPTAGEKAADKPPRAAKLPAKKAAAKKTTATAKQSNPSEASGGGSQTRAQKNGTRISSAPQLHVNIQLHISPETTAEQIDHIFGSMAKHLKTLNGE